MIETRQRSLLKAMSWRVTATLTTTLISYFITGSIDFAIKIGAIELLAKMGLYYMHERMWVKLKIGLKAPLDYQI